MIDDELFYKSLAAVLTAGAMVMLTLRYTSQSESNLSEQCVQALASMAHPKDASVRFSGDRLWLRGVEIRIRAQIENDITDRKGAFIGLIVDISVDGVPRPTLSSGVVGAGDNRNEAVKMAVWSWAYGVGEALLESLGLNDKRKTISVPNYTIHVAATRVWGSHDPKSLPGEEELVNRLRSVIESLNSSPSEFHLISISMQGEGGPSGLVQGECRVDGAPSSVAFKAVQSFPWKLGPYMFKRYYVLRRRRGP